MWGDVRTVVSLASIELTKFTRVSEMQMKLSVFRDRMSRHVTSWESCHLNSPMFLLFYFTGCIFWTGRSRDVHSSIIHRNQHQHYWWNPCLWCITLLLVTLGFRRDPKTQSSPPLLCMLFMMSCLSHTAHKMCSTIFFSRERRMVHSIR
jgi:hypothetical protein